MRENILWTNLSLSNISKQLASKGFSAGIFVVKRMLKNLGYVRRKMIKALPMKEVEHRNEQFLHIKELRKEFISCGLPVLSIDTKKKELLGNFYRDGHLYTSEAIKVFDHDFPNFSEGKIIPHGIYDVYQDKCYLTIGGSHDTAEFVCDNIEYHWENELKYLYPAAAKMLLLCDGGGSNGCRFHVVKEAIYKLAKKLEIEIVVAHYPAYCSKWNPIEHRAFSNITRAWQGVPFDSYKTVVDLAEKAETTTGFSVDVWVNEKIYQIGIKASDDFMNKYPVKFDDFLPLWNYRLN
jgi:hypothetical protein